LDDIQQSAASGANIYSFIDVEARAARRINATLSGSDLCCSLRAANRGAAEFCGLSFLFHELIAAFSASALGSFNLTIALQRSSKQLAATLLPSCFLFTPIFR
jgi:hypothetical protein